MLLPLSMARAQSSQEFTDASKARAFRLPSWWMLRGRLFITSGAAMKSRWGMRSQPLNSAIRRPARRRRVLRQPRYP